jgi:two-component sensor histidine kinase
LGSSPQKGSNSTSQTKGDRDTLTVSWTERDGPPVTPPKRRGFGSAIIASLAKTTVDGEVQLDYAPSGLVWRLSCPAANGLERDSGARPLH